MISGKQILGRILEDQDGQLNMWTHFHELWRNLPQTLSNPSVLALENYVYSVKPSYKVRTILNDCYALNLLELHTELSHFS